MKCKAECELFAYTQVRTNASFDIDSGTVKYCVYRNLVPMKRYEYKRELNTKGFITATYCYKTHVRNKKNRDVKKEELHKKRSLI